MSEECQNVKNYQNMSEDELLKETRNSLKIRPSDSEEK